MRSTMEAYPEYLGIDGTYKLLEMRTPVFIIHVEDANGCTEVVCVAVLVQEDAACLTWLLAKLKDLNPAWVNTKCIMSDKDLLERDVLRKSFPSSSLLICVFHTLRTFRKEVSCAKLNIKPHERDSVLELLQKMVNAKSEALFDELEAQLDATAPAPVTDYYNKNWRSIRHEWFTGPQFLMNSLNNTTNNRLEPSMAS